MTIHHEVELLRKEVEYLKNRIANTCDPFEIVYFEDQLEKIQDALRKVEHGDLHG